MSGPPSLVLLLVAYLAAIAARIQFLPKEQLWLPGALEVERRCSFHLKGRGRELEGGERGRLVGGIGLVSSKAKLLPRGGVFEMRQS